MDGQKLEDIEGAFVDAWATQAEIRIHLEPLELPSAYKAAGLPLAYRPAASEVANYAAGLELERALAAIHAQPNVPSMGELETSENKYVRAAAAFMRARQKTAPLADAFEEASQHVRQSPDRPAATATRPTGGRGLRRTEALKALIESSLE